MIIKSGNLQAHEAKTLIFINNETTIPVPKVRKIQYSNGHVTDVHYDQHGKATVQYEDHAVTKITMDLVAGQTLEKAWEEMGQDKKDRVAEDLCQYITQLRKFTADSIGGLDNGPARIVSAMQEVVEGGPFESEAQFNNFRQSCGVCPAVVAVDNPIVLTHGDLVPKNILVDDQGHVTGLVDWEFSGYYPLYWEHRRASKDLTPGWAQFVVQLFPEIYEREYIWGSPVLFGALI
ncbi:kinase-like domain-containing protein [Aspergillus coremiiformis]|uniref:Kinase-like domain-containing protein n=1 Tax=Aspergillus coremiiformis TaxID=138285 RepID=A0A5N6ZHU2_9EURO|nr:kinase-like domain-containing protein [Aspergillus coremiiformis]